VQVQAETIVRPRGGEEMAAKEPVAERNLDGYGAAPVAWARVRDSLEGLTQAPETGGPDRHTFWLATVRPDGRPHVMPLGVLWVDGALYAEYSAPSAGPPPWEVYEVTPTTVFGLGTAEPFGATRFNF
jgi:Pyridoxamine 5'-phosphate oxidase